MRDGFSAPGSGVSQEQWDSIFKREVKPRSKICVCGHREFFHENVYSDFGQHDGHDTHCKQCHCREFKENKPEMVDNVNGAFSIPKGIVFEPMGSTPLIPTEEVQPQDMVKR